MSYQNIMNAPLFDFGDIKKSEITIKNTWNEFQALWQIRHLNMMKLNQQ